MAKDATKLVNSTTGQEGHVFHDIETITPNLALSYLENASVNRNISEPSVKKYASAMERGQWTLSQPIIFNQMGQLIDGQHRLRAVIRSGVSIKFNVLRGVTSIMHLDAGRARKPADILSMMGYKNANVLAAIARIMIFMEDNPNGVPMPSGTGQHYITLDDVVTRVENDELLPVVASKVAGTYKELSGMLRSSAVAGWFVYTALTQMEDPETLEAFLDQVLGRAPAGHDNPAFVLYKTLNNTRTDQRRLSKLERAALLIKAWNAYIEQRPITRLFYRRFGSRAETFPQMITDATIGDSK